LGWRISFLISSQGILAGKQAIIPRKFVFSGYFLDIYIYDTKMALEIEKKQVFFSIRGV